MIDSVLKKTVPLAFISFLAVRLSENLFCEIAGCYFSFREYFEKKEIFFCKNCVGGHLIIAVMWIRITVVESNPNSDLPNKHTLSTGNGDWFLLLQPEKIPVIL